MDHEPPLSTTTEDVLTAGRRKQTRRRLGWLGGVAAVAAIVVGASVALPGASVDANTDGHPAGPTVDDDPYPVVETWEEYAEVAYGLFLEQQPDFEYKGHNDRPPFEIDVRSDNGNNMTIPSSGAAFLKTAEGKPVGSVSISMYLPGEWSDQPGHEELLFPYGILDGEPIFTCWSGETPVHQGDSSDAPTKTQITETECEEKTSPHGDRMYRVSTVIGYEGEDPESYENMVVVFRADDTAVIVRGFCGSADKDDEYGGTCHDIQFNLDQLEVIAVGLPAVIVDGG